MISRLLIGLMTFSLVFVGGAADAAAPVTRTVHAHGLVETFTDVIPTCEGGGPRYVITTTVNFVRHVTRFDDGRRHVAFTETGTFVAEPKFDSSLPSYTGKVTIRSGFNANGSIINGTFIFNVRGTGSDGSTFSNHNVGHFSEMPDGTVKEFFHCH